jgi:small subunit ribosomal protein S14
MASKGKIEHNEKRQRLISRHEESRDKLRTEIRILQRYFKENPNCTAEKRSEITRNLLKLQIKLAKLPRNSMKIRKRNRCAVTGRPRGYIGYFGVSRNVVYKNISSLAGIKKS